MNTTTRIRRSLPLAAVLFGLLHSPGLTRAASTCPGGRFLVEGDPLVAGQETLAQDVVVMTDTFVSTESGCGPVAAGFRAATGGTIVAATWAECREPGRKLSLRAKLDPTCTTLRGTFGPSRPRSRRQFIARLSSCGDGVLDADTGEQCDDGNAIGGDGCDPDCRRTSPIAPTARPQTTRAATDQPLAEQPAREHGRGKPIPGQYIVTVKAGEKARSVAAIAHVSPKWVYEHALNGFTAELNDGQLNALRHHRAVDMIEQDQEIMIDGFQVETMDRNGQPWGLDRIDQRSGRSKSYSWWLSGAYGAGQGVRVYVIDTGIATTHPDFGGRATNVYDASGGNGQDCNGHGTHVAGTIGGHTYGVAKAALLRGVRVLNCSGAFLKGSVGSGIAGIDWVKQNAIKPAVANISWHAGSKMASLNTATTNLINSGVFVSVAAANDNRDACLDSPGSAAGTMTVAASDGADTKAFFSDYGACVDLYAPGYQIESAWLNGGTNTINGTSMASPHVAGVAALLKSDYGDRASSTIKTWILNAATTNAIKSNPTGTPNRLLYMGGW